MSSISNGDEGWKIVQRTRSLESPEDDNRKTVKVKRSRSIVSPEVTDNGGGSQSSVSVEEADNGDNTEGGGDGSLKKGPWTSAEDAILVEYVQKYGEGNWSAVQKIFGLARCGKSCRLRWTNHLRPDLRKGAFTVEEENLLVEQHYILRNKWARIALSLPGRTDNEIKNYWHTRTKRLKKAGLPIYPEEIVQRANMNQEHLNADMGANQPDDSQAENFDIPDVVFKDFKLDRDAIVLPQHLDMQGSGLVYQSIDSVYNILSVPPSKRIRLEDTTLNSLENYTSNAAACKNYRMLSPPLSPSCDSILYDSNNHVQDDNLIIGGHVHDDNLAFAGAALNNISSSELMYDGGTRNELPSFQYTQQCSLDTHTSRFPLHEFVDTSIQFPPSENPNQSVLYPDSRGLPNTRLFQNNSNGTNVQEGIERTAFNEGFKNSSYNPYDESSAQFQCSRYNNNHISMLSIDESHLLQTPQDYGGINQNSHFIDNSVMNGDLNQINLTQQDALSDFNPRGINQNGFNQLTTHSSMINLNQINLAHQDDLFDFSTPAGINQNASNQFTDNYSVNGHLNQLDLTHTDDFSWCRYISEPNMNNTEYI